MNYMCVCVFTTKILTTVRDFHSLVYHLYKSNHGNFPINSEFFSSEVLLYKSFNNYDKLKLCIITKNIFIYKLLI